MAAAWCGGTVLTPLTFEGYCDRALIEAWFETQLCPALRPGQVVRVPFGQGQCVFPSPRAFGWVVGAGGLLTIAVTSLLT